MLAGLCDASLADESATNPKPGEMQILIDARELPRSLLSSTIRIPIEPQDVDREVALWYPKWVPGSHGPGGPIANLAGLEIKDAAGKPLMWSRSPGEVYRLVVDVPANVDQLNVAVRYIANQPTTNSFGHDVFAATHLGIISSGAVLFYAEGDRIDESMIQCDLRLPRGWQAASALQVDSEADPDSPLRTDALPSEIVSFRAATLRTLVDSPIMCGPYHQSYSLRDPAMGDLVAPHRLEVFGDTPEAAELNPDIIQKWTAMVSQTAKLTGSQPFDEFTVLLGVSDQLPANGLEHSRSTLNVLAPGSLRSAASLKGWSRLLVPHEYLHTWCGKYRRPAGMVTENFHDAKDTELLWVYEGLTQYLGEVIEARAGLMSTDELRHRISVELRNATHQQNRRWRPLADTAAASHILRGRSNSWSRLRGGQDYYMEGMLFWLEVDAILRSESGGKLTLDDFCQRFFQVDRSPANAQASPPKSFDRDEIVSTLGQLMPMDWDGLIRRRVESVQPIFDPAVADRLGYRFEATSTAPAIPASTFRYPSGVDLFDSIGVIFGGDGSVSDIRLDSPADRAKLGPGMKVIGVEAMKWNAARMKAAVAGAAGLRPIELLVEDGQHLRTIQIQYFEGAKYLSLLPIDGRVDLIESIAKPK